MEGETEIQNRIFCYEYNGGFRRPGYGDPDGLFYKGDLYPDAQRRLGGN